MVFNILGLSYSRNEQILREKDWAPKYYHPESLYFTWTHLKHIF